MTRDQWRARVLSWVKRANTGLMPIDDVLDFAAEELAQLVRFHLLDTQVALDPELANVVEGNVHAHQLPVNFNGVWRLTNNRVGVSRLQPDALKERRGSPLGMENRPSAYAVVGSALWTAPGAGGDLQLIYHAKDQLPRLGGDTNVGMAQAPRLYLAAGLKWAYRWAEDRDAEDRWEAAQNSGVQAQNMIEDEKRHSGAGAAS